MPQTERETRPLITVDLPVEGLDCADCAGAVERALSALDGVAAASVPFGAGRAHVTYDPGRIQPARLASEIEALGFRVRAANGARVLRLRLGGLDCAECAEQIAAALRAQPGVREATVLFAAAQAVVRYDPSQISPAALVRAIVDLGYEATEERDAPSPTTRAPAQTLAARLGWLFVSAVAAVTLLALLAERLGLAERALDLVPAPVAVAAVLLGGLPIFRNVARNLRRRIVTPHALMTLGILGALAIGQPATAAVIVFFMRFADWLDARTAAHARHALRELVSVAPATAHVVRDGREVDLPAAAVAVGEIVVVRPGEKIPVDGEVIAGETLVDQAPITGESLPVAKLPGDEVFAATINHAGVIRVRTTRVGADTTFGHIVRLVEEAEAHKAPVQRLADRITAYYLPVVLVAAALAFFVGGSATAAVAVLVVSCSCAIALATPVAVIASVGASARRGLLVKGGLALERLAQMDTLLLDKTGTVTLGRPRISAVIALGAATEEEVLALAATAERYSEHPLAEAVRRAAHDRGVAPGEVAEVEVRIGAGVAARCGGRTLLLGNRRLMAAHGVAVGPAVERTLATLEDAGQTPLLLAADGQIVGLLAAEDELRPGVVAALAELRRLGVQQMVLLTGDHARVARVVAEQLGVAYQADLRPEEKIAVVRQLQAAGHVVGMIGDGINDGPALAQADVGLAMGRAATAVATEAAKVVLLRADWRLVPEAIRVGRRTFRTIQQNLAIAVLYNVLGLGLAAAGLLPPIVAAAAQSLPDVLVMLNSARLLRQ